MRLVMGGCGGPRVPELEKSSHLLFKLLPINTSFPFVGMSPCGGLDTAGSVGCEQRKEGCATVGLLA